MVEFKTPKANSPINRERLALFLSPMIEGSFTTNFRPYTINNDDCHWSLASSNNWFLTIAEDNMSFMIRHRYSEDKAEAFAMWIDARTGYIRMK